MRALVKFVADSIEQSEIEDLISLVISMEKELASLDFTEPLYKYFKSVMEKEMPEGL
jgi:hypothetical protein